MSLRRQFRMSTTPRAKQMVEQIAARRGMTEQAVISRLVEWFARQDEMLQLGIIGQWPDAHDEALARLAIKSLVRKKPKGK